MIKDYTLHQVLSNSSNEKLSYGSSTYAQEMTAQLKHDFRCNTSYYEVKNLPR
jgi:hypothetical protein